MVRIIGKTLEEIAEERKREKLFSITSSTIKKPLTVQADAEREYIVIRDFSGYIQIEIHPNENLINVSSKVYLKSAITLANKYEKELSGEFTVKKDY